MDDLSRGPVGFGTPLLSEESTCVEGRSVFLKLTNQGLSCLLCLLHTRKTSNTKMEYFWQLLTPIMCYCLTADIRFLDVSFATYMRPYMFLLMIVLAFHQCQNEYSC
jgi:hypothetical protein